MEDDGWRWAPSTVHPVPVKGEKPATCLSKGEVLSCLSGSLRPDEPFILFKECARGRDGKYYLSFVGNTGRAYQVAYDDFAEIGDFSDGAIVLRYMPRLGEEEFEFDTIGALVKDVRSQSAFYFGTFACQTKVSCRRKYDFGSDVDFTSVDAVVDGTWRVS